LLDWGLTNFFNRRLAISTENFARDAGSLVFLRLIAACVYAIIICGIAYFSGVKRWDILIAVIVVQILTSMFVFFRAIITSQQWFSIDAWLSVLDKILMILLCGSLLYFPLFMGSINIDRFLMIQIFCTATANIVTLIILFRKKFYFAFTHLWPEKYVFRTALPFAIILLLMSFHSRIDGFLLERISGAEEAGKYAASYRLLDAANTIGYLFASFLLPFISRNWNEKNDISSVALRVRHILVLMSIAVIGITLFLAPWIQELLYHNSNEGYINVMRWCLPALMGYSLVQVYGTILTATGMVNYFSYILIGSVIVNLFLNIVLIPGHGAIGSCIAALVSQLATGIATMILVNKKLAIRIHFQSWLIYIFIASVLCLFLYLATRAQLNNWLIIFISGVIVLGLGFITRVIDLNSWKQQPKLNS
jgi:O-antigen/teichoic acid export membrane protein